MPHHRKRVCSIDDFFSRVTFDSLDPTDETACWTYRGPNDERRGYLYGLYCNELAHRVAACLYVGSIVGTVRRGCGNSLCVRRDHFDSVGWVEEKPIAERKKDDGSLNVDMNSDLMKLIAELRYNNEPVTYVNVRLNLKREVGRALLSRYIQKSTIPLLLYEKYRLTQSKKKPPLIPTMPFTPELAEITSKSFIKNQKQFTTGVNDYEYADCFPISEIG